MDEQAAASAGLKTRSNSRNVHDDKSQSTATSAPRLLYVVSEDWYFLSHRLPMARAARDAGFEVHVATRVQNGAAAIEAEGFVLHPIPFVRGRLSPGAFLATILALRRIHRTVAPVITHHVSVQSAVLGMIATLGRPVACVNALTGLGYTFTSTSVKAAVVGLIIRSVFRTLFNRERVISLVQNDDDRAAVVAVGISQSRIALIAGSGVDIARLSPLTEPTGPHTAAFAGRLLDDKGIRTLVTAHRLVRERDADARLLIAGTPDPANPASVSQKEAASWDDVPGITWLGQVDDIANLWARAHVAVLPSRREGLPLSLLEAAACGRAMVATDVPGCREIVIPGKTGLLVPVDDASALADAIGKLLREPELRAQFAVAARRLVVEQFSAEIIGQQTVALYRTLLAPLNSSSAARSELL
jgi:glycosyltransferase involved in cell wall biosynthesis